jgi:hypothetical protein
MNEEDQNENHSCTCEGCFWQTDCDKLLTNEDRRGMNMNGCEYFDDTLINSECDTYLFTEMAMSGSDYHLNRMIEKNRKEYNSAYLEYVDGWN